MKFPILSGERDTPIWCLSTHGNFTLSSAWDLGRSRKASIPLLDNIWNPGITASISIFIWRLLSNRIPVDSKLQWRGISLASKCCCCESPHSAESLQHLFINSQGAEAVWAEFDPWFPGLQPRLQPLDSIPDRTEAWAHRMAIETKDHVSRIVPCLIFWFTWAERNNSRHKNEKFRAFNISWQVRMHLRKLTLNDVLGPTQWRGCKADLDLEPRQRLRGRATLPISVKWQPPDPPSIKLNVAGNFNSSERRGYVGGIFRDHTGSLVSAFAVSLPARSHVETELMAIHQGLLRGRDLESHLCVEIDSSQAISILKKGSTGPALARTTTARIRLLCRSTNSRLSSTPRAGNKIARSIATMAPANGNAFTFNQQSAPAYLKAMVHLEKLGCPNIVLEEDDPP